MVSCLFCLLSLVDGHIGLTLWQAQVDGKMVKMGERTGLLKKSVPRRFIGVVICHLSGVFEPRCITSMIGSYNHISSHLFKILTSKMFTWHLPMIHLGDCYYFFLSNQRCQESEIQDRRSCPCRRSWKPRWESCDNRDTVWTTWFSIELYLQFIYIYICLFILCIYTVYIFTPSRSTLVVNFVQCMALSEKHAY